VRKALDAVPVLSGQTLTLLTLAAVTLLIPVTFATAFLLVREAQRNDRQERISCAGYASRITELHRAKDGLFMRQSYYRYLENEVIPDLEQRARELGC
jgi:hypothetical protein